MISKIDVRNLIKDTKSRLDKTGDKQCILKIAIYKGLYNAIGGKKYITLAPSYEDIAVKSEIVFGYLIKSIETPNNNRALNYLVRSLIKNGYKPSDFIDENTNSSKDGIIKLITQLIVYDHPEDIIINEYSIKNIVLLILKLFGKRGIEHGSKL